MQVHLDALGWLHVLAGWVGVVTGVAFLLLAAGTSTLVAEPAGEAGVTAVVWLLVAAGVAFVTGGVLMIVTGHGLVARRPRARFSALLLALPNLCALPFGTALGVYTLWALLNDDARSAFGRKRRGGAAAP
jgi:hypothetical protein